MKEITKTELMGRAAQLAAKLTPEQVKYAAYLAVPSKYRRSKKSMCEEFGISYTGIAKWTMKPEFQELKKEFVYIYFNEFVPDVVQSMHEKALAGDVGAARLFLEFVKEIGQTNSVHVTNLTIVGAEEVKQKLAELSGKFIDAEYAEKPTEDE